MQNFKSFLTESSFIEENFIIDEKVFALAKDLAIWLESKELLNETTKKRTVEDEVLDDKDLETKTTKNGGLIDPTDDAEFDMEKEIEDDVDEEDVRTDDDLDLTDDGKTPEIERNDERIAQKWAENVYEAKNPDPKLTNYRTTYTVLSGRMYAFKYDPKHKKRLNVYDTNPLVMVFDFKPGADDSHGFLGINLHYVPRAERKNVVQYFIQKNPEAAMKKGILDIDYEMDLKNNPKMAYLYFCIRHYLLNHVIGSLKEIPQNEYPIAYKLHSANFFPIGQSEQQIYQNIRRRGVDRTLSTILTRTQHKKDIANQKRREKLKAQREAEKQAKLKDQITPVKGENVVSDELKKEKEIKIINNPLE